MLIKVKHMKDEYYTLKEIAKMLKVSYMTVFRWVKLGKLAANKVGKQHRVKKEVLESFIEAT
jgi:excisionase family DNA binding protein